MAKGIIGVIVAALLIVGGFYFFRTTGSGPLGMSPTVPPPSPAPVGTSTASTREIVELGLNKSATLLDVKITPLEVLEDSRCPIDVQCIQAGRVRVRVELVSGLGTAREIFEIDKSITTEAEEVKLLNVLPLPKAGQKIPLNSYVFSFQISKR
jgi:hypothetical protein